MRIFLNGEVMEVRAETLSQVLQECGYEGDHFATAVNEVFVHKQQRASHLLSEDDRVEIVAPMEGG